ncbi:MAG: hypothetical protein D6801_00795 [Alphaproteobacteria bacterium]|nr:MAG: hypothetical protein D6801_00795 [Alphaproteobacteria bacterium]
MAKAPKADGSEEAGKATNGPAGEAEDAVVIEEVPPAEKGTAEREAAPSSDEHSSTQAPSDETAEEPLSPVQPGPQPARRGGLASMLALVAGGVLAAVIGFVAARTIVPEGWPFPGVTPEPDPVAVAVETQGKEIAALRAAVQALESDVSALRADTALSDTRRDLTARIDALAQSVSETRARLEALETRLAAVEKLAPEGSEAAQKAAEAYARELQALREMFAAELDKIRAEQGDVEALSAQAAAAARAAEARAALARVNEALAELSSLTDAEIPPALAEAAASGVPTLAALQDTFPPAAREAIAAALRDAVEKGEISRTTAFLKIQLGTRSLTPRPGDDADAILSRAEDALRKGDLAAALAELDTLPEAAKPAMADWRSAAERRLAATRAAEALAKTLNTN